MGIENKNSSVKKISREESLLKRRKEIDEKLKKFNIQKNTKAKKLNLQRKFIVGEAVLAYVAKDAEFAKLLRKALKESVTKQRDLDAIADLINVPSEQPAIEETTDLTSKLSTEETTVENSPAIQNDSRL